FRKLASHFGVAEKGARNSLSLLTPIIYAATELTRLNRNGRTRLAASVHCSPPQPILSHKAGCQAPGLFCYTSSVRHNSVQIRCVACPCIAELIARSRTDEEDRFWSHLRLRG